MCLLHCCIHGQQKHLRAAGCAFPVTTQRMHVWATAAAGPIDSVTDLLCPFSCCICHQCQGHKLSPVQTFAQGHVQAGPHCRMLANTCTQHAWSAHRRAGVTAATARKEHTQAPEATGCLQLLLMSVKKPSELPTSCQTSWRLLQEWYLLSAQFIAWPLPRPCSTTAAHHESSRMHVLGEL